mmetsp:Transcript_91625/g.147920  ORF Transcript_91625/g.147920 Transcript_91625/m.147920 type:complete len:162 (-) Transcript_91625:1104-1589(-)
MKLNPHPQKKPAYLQKSPTYQQKSTSYPRQPLISRTCTECWAAKQESVLQRVLQRVAVYQQKSPSLPRQPLILRTCNECWAATGRNVPHLQKSPTYQQKSPSYPCQPLISRTAFGSNGGEMCHFCCFVLLDLHPLCCYEPHRECVSVLICGFSKGRANSVH